MKNLLIIFFAASLLISCKEESSGTTTTTSTDSQEETMTAGSLTLYVDTTAQPIIEDVLAVFSSIYDKAHIKQVNRNENDVVNALIKDSARVAVLARPLTEKEEQNFTKLGIKPKVTFFATDALALITNKTSTDTVVNLQEIYKVLQGKKSATVKKLIFDNSNSGTVQLLLKEAGVTKIATTDVYSLKDTEAVFKYVQENPGSIGIIGVNWLVQPPTAWEKYVENVRVMGVDNVKVDKGQKKYYKPSQSNIAGGLYPLTRKLYVLNYQGKNGLGMGFATYITDESGQRIILKSGLVPAVMPTREIEIRNEL
ncbi:phosphate ABC transporter substrate-binding protein [Flavobacterium zepuense]|uniref:Phosphate ABC transporter substrate-binding protein n=1 Tax=Flavobacterium zepuense TaxID=2593302 RepID=A0A552UV08_9FLAO|nr:substrate-binding domain-containing protein [Flavobacterium zepuense]TRW22078.1 phosphate ABC transporter substrate-binding protein [Flavobacterium zepuense]